MIQPEFQEIADRVLPGSGALEIRRTPAGGSTPVYRIARDPVTLYLRLAETEAASLAPEARVHDLLRARGVRVPEVVHFEPLNPIVQRSVMVTTEIPGASLAEDHRGLDPRPLLIAAGRDLAVINQLPVEGYGWVRRDRPRTAPLTAEHATLRAFALADLDASLASIAPCFTLAEQRAIHWQLDRELGLLDDGADGAAVLAHGDFDATHIFHARGAYTGIIDFGEIRGADPYYDLGHLALHDRQALPFAALPDVLTGYAEVAPLPADVQERIDRWQLLIGIHRLSRVMARPEPDYRTHLLAAIRRVIGGR